MGLSVKVWLTIDSDDITYDKAIAMASSWINVMNSRGILFNDTVLELYMDTDKMVRLEEVKCT